MEYPITSAYDGMEIKTYFYGVLHFSTRILKRLKYRCDGQGILVNGEPQNVRYRLRAGDVLTLRLEDSEGSQHIAPCELPLPVLYEDDDLIVVNKPPHMPTHPTHGHLDDTVANALAAYYARRSRPFVFRPGSRLDRDTSGILPVAKNQQAANHLYRCHRSGLTDKQYDVIVRGCPDPPQGVIDLPIRRAADSVIMRVAGDGGSPARTEYRTVKTVTGPDGKTVSLVRAVLRTGRTHQLRVHFSAIGCPVVGDTLYGGEEMARYPRQAVHCAGLSFPHPTSGETLVFTVPLPDDLAALLPPDGTEADRMEE